MTVELAAKITEFATVLPSSSSSASLQTTAHASQNTECHFSDGV